MAGVGAFGSAGRAVLGLANAAFDRQRKLHPKTKRNARTFQERFRSARGGRERLRVLASCSVGHFLLVSSRKAGRPSAALGAGRMKLLPLVIGWLAGWFAVAQSPPPPVVLPPPRLEGGKPLMQALKERKTSREFSAEPLAAQVMSELLWAGFGMNRPEVAHRTAPSAMNSQEIDLYVATAEGLYLYEAKEHRLLGVKTEDIRGKTGGQPFIKEAPVALIYVADLARLSKAKPEDRQFYASVDAGSIIQNVYLYCASAGLASVVHEVDREVLTQAMPLRPEQKVILAHSVGWPKKSASGTQ
jgi:nitroreductase